MKNLKKRLLFCIVCMIGIMLIVTGCSNIENDSSLSQSTPTESSSTADSSTESSPEDDEEEFKPIQPGGNYDVGSGY